ncbi:hypothetical protein [Streptococcus sanguinis]|uniref:hypothetical protein n=1 Tax=Streptococcus sanguinis TaxID=1305 RepID=UPI001CC0175E|nr:hypothetical protein [Streptococcus sanguinis]MBZ2072411.1 hypothetical protein [Streptococcus sanguinis]MBZ2080626.1 hypothetical protein [Streptococcus sanguinis]MCC3164931.1 hypothetical protein [Streptococcus sanguinis]
MITSVIFIASLLFLLRRFKSRRSRIIIGLLYSLFVVWYVQAILNYGKYTLQPGQSAELRVFPNTNQLEYSSELMLKKLNDAKIKLSGTNVWSEKFGDVLFGLSEKKIIKIGSIEGDKNELLNNQKDIHLAEDGIVVSYKGEKVFDVTNNKSYSITITNVDNKPAKFETQVVDK